MTDNECKECSAPLTTRIEDEANMCHPCLIHYGEEPHSWTSFYSWTAEDEYDDLYYEIGDYDDVD